MWELLARRTGGTAAGFAWARAVDGGVDLYVATPVGVLRSIDGGRTWEAPAPRAAAPVAGTVAVSPAYAEDGTLFAGGRDGVFRSADRGLSWRHLLTGTTAFDLAALPSGMLHAATEADGVLRSADGGDTWQGANAGLLDLTVLALSFADDRTGFAGTTAGLYRTRNGGQAWRALDLGPEEPAVQALALSPRFAEDRLVFAGTEAAGLFRTADGGATWETVEAIGATGVTAIAVAAHGERIIAAAATEAGVFVSPDGGEHWDVTGPLPAPALALAFVPDDDEPRLLAGLAGAGVMRLGADDRAWAAANDGFHAVLTTALRPSPAFDGDGTLFALAADGVLGISSDRGLTWSERVVAPGAATLGLTLSPDYATDRTLWIETSDGLLVSRDGGERWDPVPADEMLPVTEAPDVPAAPIDEGDGPDAIVALTRSPSYERDGLIFAAEPGGAIWRFREER